MRSKMIKIFSRSILPCPIFSPRVIPEAMTTRKMLMSGETKIKDETKIPKKKLTMHIRISRSIVESDSHVVGEGGGNLVASVV